MSLKGLGAKTLVQNTRECGETPAVAFVYFSPTANDSSCSISEDFKAFVDNTLTYLDDTLSAKSYGMLHGSPQ